jgi:hypothetical protein
MRRCLFAFVLMIGASAFAQDAPDRVPPELRACLSIQRNAERLSCFDRAIAMLAAGKEGSALVAATPEASFGLGAGIRETPAKAEEGDGDLQSVQSTVKGFARSADGSIVIRLENGQSWRQLSGTDTLLKVGDNVTITRAALGSFQMKVPTGRSAKVRRIS